MKKITMWNSDLPNSSFVIEAKSLTEAKSWFFSKFNKNPDKIEITFAF